MNDPQNSESIDIGELIEKRIEIFDEMINRAHENVMLSGEEIARIQFQYAQSIAVLTTAYAELFKARFAP